MLITVSFIFRTVLERSKINIDTVLTYCRCSLNDVGLLDYMNFFKVRFKAALSWQLVGNKMCLNWLSMLHLKANLLSMLPVSKLTPNTPPLKQILFFIREGWVPFLYINFLNFDYFLKVLINFINYKCSEANCLSSRWNVPKVSKWLSSLVWILKWW